MLMKKLFSLNRISFVLNERKPRFIYMHVRVNVAIFNVCSTKAMAPVKSAVETVRSQRIRIHLESENFNRTWSLFLIDFELFFLLLSLRCNITLSHAFVLRHSIQNHSSGLPVNQNTNLPTYADKNTTKNGVTRSLIPWT